MHHHFGEYFIKLTKYGPQKGILHLISLPMTNLCLFLHFSDKVTLTLVKSSMDILGARNSVTALEILFQQR